MLHAPHFAPEVLQVVDELAREGDELRASLPLRRLLLFGAGKRERLLLVQDPVANSRTRNAKLPGSGPNPGSHGDFDDLAFLGNGVGTLAHH
jgi:hypothetical protein